MSRAAWLDQGYRVLRPLLFRLEPESAHDLASHSLAWISRHPGALRLLQGWQTALNSAERALLHSRHFGVDFPNPIGLAAGMDKHAAAVPAWAALGFGFVEVGSVTAQAQAGNPKPRLFRLPQDEALINRFGFNNLGADAIAAHLAASQSRATWPSLPLGINLGKSKITPLAQALGDYQHSLEQLGHYADYVVINVSSPNTPGLRQLQDQHYLDDLLSGLQASAQGVPLLLKIAPDMHASALDSIISLVKQHRLAGIIACNTTTERQGLCSPTSLSDQIGGLSGKPLAERSLELLHYLYQALGDAQAIVSVGGISSVDDVYQRLQAGAALVQLYSALVYQGPMLVQRLQQGLLQRLQAEGVQRLAEIRR